MIIEKMETVIYVTGVVDTQKRLRSGAYEPSLGDRSFASTNATEFHLNRGRPSPKRQFRLRSPRAQEECFNAVEAAIGGREALLFLRAAETGEVWQIDVSSVRYEIRLKGQKEEGLTGVHNCELFAADTSLGQFKVNVLESMSELVEAIVLESENLTPSDLQAALGRNEKCRLTFSPPSPSPSEPDKN
ncbi:hypothetical protein DTL21_02205 [Bremerella cremea]|uniref:Uncharacterized protein n=1 Tax=Blastopirellula marina TaxID=124 RepID=A0A2S8G547_9BACT|nr:MULTISPECIES: hypothetical protein [Pirellulaceae]PQO39579.1 hypothetical protein C5Y83_02205 [Blastopirellula marina]RCS51046.1 hypothetical protein DTL21_02205 [Bremerella cremea]